MSSISSDTNELNSILGTYRGWGNFQVAHLILMISVLTGLVYQLFLLYFNTLLLVILL